MATPEGRWHASRARDFMQSFKFLTGQKQPKEGLVGSVARPSYRELLPRKRAVALPRIVGVSGGRVMLCVFVTFSGSSQAGRI